MRPFDVLEGDLFPTLHGLTGRRAGVCRVYLQQCSYILTDAQNVQLDMRRLLRAVRDDGNIDPEAGRTARSV